MLLFANLSKVNIEVNYNYQTRKFYGNYNYSQIGISVGCQF